MKKVFYFFVIALSLVFLATSCNKDNELNDSAITNDVADDIAASLGKSNSGLSGELEDIAKLAAEYPNTKAATLDTIYSVDTTFTRSSAEGAIISYSYSFHAEWGYVLQGATLNNIYYNAVVEGSYDAPRIGGSGNREGHWVMTGLQISSPTYIINGTSARLGNSHSKVRKKSTITSNSEVTLTDVKVDKSTYLIKGGTLSWNISGTVNDKEYSYSATIIFNGDGTAGLSINGTSYTIDLSKGETK